MKIVSRCPTAPTKTNRDIFNSLKVGEVYMWTSPTGGEKYFYMKTTKNGVMRLDGTYIELENHSVLTSLTPIIPLPNAYLVTGEE